MNVRLEGFHCVGYIKAAHGISGELFVQLFTPEADWLGNANKLFLLPAHETAASALQTFEDFKLRRHKAGLIFKSGAIKDRNLAETYKGARVFVREEALRSAPGDRIFLREILGFNVVGKEGQVLGKIEDFSSNGAQDLLVVRTLGNTTALVPFVDDFIVEVDFSNEAITMDLPPGLLTVDQSE